jgi:hypothetical protein
MKLKLLTESIKKKLIDNYNKNQNDGTLSFKAVVKLFNPSGIGTWFLSELNPKDNIAFGLCCLQEEEVGYVSLEELKSLKSSPFGLGIERDLYFKPNKKTLDECRTKPHP